MTTYNMASFASDGSLWIVDSTNTALRYVDDGNYAADGGTRPMAAVSVGSGALVWGIDTTGQPVQLTGSPMPLVSGNCFWVSAGNDGTVWRAGQQQFLRLKSDGTWESMPLVPSQFGSIAGNVYVGDAATVWTIAGQNFDNPAWRWNGSGWVNAGGPGNGFSGMTIGTDGSVWGFSQYLQQLYRYVSDNNWTGIPAPVQRPAWFSALTATDIWATDFYRNLYHWNGESWQARPGAQDTVTLAPDGTVYGFAVTSPYPNPAAVISRYNGFGGWIALPLVVQNSVFAPVSSTSMWIVDRQDNANNLYSWAGMAWQNMGSTLLDSIAGAADGTVWGVDKTNKPVRYNGTSWDAMPGQATQIAVGSASLVWCVDPSGNPQTWNGAAWQPATPLGQAILSLAIGSDGIAWAVGSDNKLYSLAPGGAWRFAVVSKLAQIAGGDTNHLAGVTKLNNQYSPPTNSVWIGSGLQP